MPHEHTNALEGKAMIDYAKGIVAELDSAYSAWLRDDNEMAIHALCNCDQSLESLLRRVRDMAQRLRDETTEKE